MSLFDPPGTNIILRVGLDRRCKKAPSTWLWLFLFLQFILSKCSALRLMFCYCQELTLQTSLLDHLYSLKLLHGDKKMEGLGLNCCFLNTIIFQEMKTTALHLSDNLQNPANICCKQPHPRVRKDTRGNLDQRAAQKPT